MAKDPPHLLQALRRNARPRVEQPFPEVYRSGFLEVCNDRPRGVLSNSRALQVDDRFVDRRYALESMADHPLYAALMSPGPALQSLEMVEAFRDLAGFGVMLIDTPQPNRRVVLDESGSLQIDYTLSEADKKRFSEGIAEAIRVMFKAGAKGFTCRLQKTFLGDGMSEPKPGVETGVQPQVLTSPDQAELVEKNLRLIANESIVTSAHMQATDKMGASLRNSVVGQDFHVWGTDGLYVVDGSDFPTSVGTNPMQSIYTIAKIFADNWNRQNNEPTLAGRIPE